MRTHHHARSSRALATAAWVALTLAAAPLPAQEEAAPEQAAQDDGPLVFPRDAERVVAHVAGDAVTFGALVDHVVARHDPLFANFLQTPGGKRCFTQDRFGADWVRQYADVLALQAEARRRDKPLEGADPALGEALKAGFEPWIQSQDLPAEPTQEMVDSYLARYQRYYGLGTEVRGWLAYLVADEATVDELRDYYAAHPTVFGGYVTFAHILVRHRDPVTLRLLPAGQRKEAWDRIADLQQRLEDDGSNFGKLAAEFSDDRTTAVRGGTFEAVRRFHPTLPAVLCRTAWQLPEGKVSEPVESAYGIHLVRKVKFNLRSTFLFTPGSYDTVRGYRTQNLREDLLFGARNAMRVRLLY